MISHGYAEANNPCLPKTFNPFKPRTYILYLDANNLHGEGMVQFLPTGDFRFLSENEINRNFSEYNTNVMA